MQIKTNRIILQSGLFIFLGLLLVACGSGTDDATATVSPTEPPADALPTAPPQAEVTETATTVPLPEPTATDPANEDEPLPTETASPSDDGYPAPTQAPPPVDDGYPAVQPTSPPATGGAYPGPEGAADGNLSFIVTSFGPIGSEQELIAGTEITAVFSATTVSGSGGCNNYSAELIYEGTTFSVGVVVSTQMACSEPEGVFAQEQAYFEALQSVDGYNWGEIGEDSILFYTLEDGTAGLINLTPITE